MRYLLLFLIVPTLASAHGLVTTQTAVVGNYIVEFEYNTLGSIFAGDYTVYDVYLLKQPSREPVDFDSAFIRIEKQNGPAVMAGSLNESSDIKGYASMSGVINEGGNYTALVYFYKGGTALAQNSFNFAVKPMAPNSIPASQSKSVQYFIGIFLAGLIVGGGLSWFSKGWKR